MGEFDASGGDASIRSINGSRNPFGLHPPSRCASRSESMKECARLAYPEASACACSSASSIRECTWRWPSSVLRSGDEVSRMCSSDPREQLTRPTQHTCLGPARHIRVALLMREHVRSEAVVVLQIRPKTETARFVPDAAFHARYAHLTAFVQAPQRQANPDVHALRRLVQARHRGAAASRILLRGVGREILERARGLPETRQLDTGGLARSKVLHGACAGRSPPDRSGSVRRRPGHRRRGRNIPGFVEHLADGVDPACRDTVDRKRRCGGYHRKHNSCHGEQSDDEANHDRVCRCSAPLPRTVDTCPRKSRGCSVVGARCGVGRVTETPSGRTCPGISAP